MIARRPALSASSSRRPSSLARSRLDPGDRVERGLQVVVALVGQDDELRPSVGRIGDALHIAHPLEVIDKLTHRLRCHRCALGEMGQADAVELDVHEHHRVRVPDRMPCGLHSFEDALAQYSPCLTEEGGGVVLGLSQLPSTP